MDDNGLPGAWFGWLVIVVSTIAVVGLVAGLMWFGNLLQSLS